MGILCCFASPSTVDEGSAAIDVPARGAVEADVGQAAGPEAQRPGPGAMVPARAPVQKQQQDAEKPWSKLNETESAAVKHTLLKVGAERPRSGLAVHRKLHNAGAASRCSCRRPGGQFCEHCGLFMIANAVQPCDVLPFGNTLGLLLSVIGAARCPASLPAGQRAH